MENIENEEELKNTGGPKNVNSDYNQRVGMGNQPDPSAKRNVAQNGDTERTGQKDQLQNLHIGGNEATGYGANDPKSIESHAQGPGFEFEGSDTAMDDSVSGIRTGDQKFGDDEKTADNADHSRI
ncbi:hypothetical protein [Pontibacter arcticus]|uniref:Uncharacterized protein n=1 Tax=Pontibacter arcticus TaxID=2080288 RepID=A0A364RBW5_9BACT|nr:hypothetical protein [Pontibacter arcticus]RAU81769.1 hypothetical protein DP923_13795 [Pontibacter arcticus]